MTEWLYQHVLHYDHEFEHLKERVYRRFHELKIVPPTPDRIERLIRSAIYTYEESFFQATYQKLPSRSLAQLDSLIDSISYLVDEDEAASDGNMQISFNELKSDPGRVGVDSVLKEVNKLRTIRNLELPDDLFRDIPQKVLKKYRQRFSTEDLRELRQHPDPIRYTLLSAFFWLRCMEMSDNLVDPLIQIIHRIGVRAERKIEKKF